MAQGKFNVAQGSLLTAWAIGELYKHRDALGLPRRRRPAGHQYPAAAAAVPPPSPHALANVQEAVLPNQIAQPAVEPPTETEPRAPPANRPLAEPTWPAVDSPIVFDHHPASLAAEVAQQAAAIPAKTYDQASLKVRYSSF